MSDLALLVTAFLLILSIVLSKASGRLGIPGLLLFLILGMVAGKEGPGGIEFRDYQITQFVGTIALILILYSGGLETRWKDTRPILKTGVVLSTLGVLLTTLITGYAVMLLFHVPLLPALLMGAIVSSTDASAVFNVLKERALELKGNIRPLLEFKSGSNDPMAVFLVLGLIQLIQSPDLTWSAVLPKFIHQMGIGGALGYGLGQVAVLLMGRIRLLFDGLYAVLSVAVALLIYAIPAVMGGSGFLAVYIAGLVIGNRTFQHKNNVLQFHDAATWLVGICMFLMLGLLVVPSQLLAVAPPALALSLVLMFIARPLGVYLSTLFSKMPFAEKTMIAWVGLRGAVPITLATFPLLAGVEHAQPFFNTAFFIVLSSVLLQGTTLPLVARWLNVGHPAPPVPSMPLQHSPAQEDLTRLRDICIPQGSHLHNTTVQDLGLEQGNLVVLICRDGQYMVPHGETLLQEGDTLQVLGHPATLTELENRVSVAAEKQQPSEGQNIS